MASNKNGLFKTVFSYVYGNVNQNRIKILGATLIDALTTSINVAAPIIIVDALENQSNTSESDFELQQYYPVIGSAAALLIAQSLPKFRDMLVNSVRANVQKELTMAMVKKSYEIELDHMLTTRTGEFAQALTKNYSTIDKAMPSLYSEILPITLEVLATTSVLTKRYGPIGLTQPAVLAFFLLVSIMCERNSKTAAIRKECTEESYRAYGKIIEIIGKYQVAHQFGNTAYELHEADKALKKSEDLYRKNYVTDDKHSLLLSVVNSIGFVGSLALWGLKPPKNFNGFDFSLVAYFMVRFNANLQILPKSISSLCTAFEDSKKIIKFLNRESTVVDPKNPVKLKIQSPPKIEFKNVSFKYGEKEILNNISFTLNPGEKLSIVGPTGAGKSTIIKLLQRFYPIQNGEITINDIGINKVYASDLRKNFAIISQDENLFYGTVSDNIKYGDLNAMEKDILTVSKFSELIRQNHKEDINKLDHQVGRGGAKLSGGERQRVNMARALLKDGFVYLLDEPTSKLDPKTEEDIQKTLDDITRESSTLLVTHRLNTVVNSNKILYLEKGAIVEQGTFEELMELKGKFFDQFKVQCKELGIDINDISPSEKKVQAEENKELKEFLISRRMRSQTELLTYEQSNSNKSNKEFKNRNLWYKNQYDNNSEMLDLLINEDNNDSSINRKKQKPKNKNFL